MLKKSKKTPRSFHEKVTAPVILPGAKKKSKNRNTSFFNQLNPFTWFNEFSEIAISLEEFSCAKK